jgi:gliding motility-associated-like protein
MNYLIVPPVTGPDVTYLWQDGSKGSFYSASRTGNYSVTIHKGNCVAHDDINVEFFHFSQNIRDTFICKGEPINLDLVANPPVGGKVLWNDGTTNPIKTVHESGTYWVYVSMNECEILDTVHVVTGFCSCWHNVPSAFTPNGDGLNDMLRPTIQPGCNISGYQFSIFNRWGEQVFTSDIPGKGWDGMYKGEPADMGVYMYSLQFFTSIFDKQSAVSGTITLIR